MALLLDLAPTVLVALQSPSDRPGLVLDVTMIGSQFKLKINLMNPVEPILSSGQYVCNNGHSLLAVGKLADVALQV